MAKEIEYDQAKFDLAVEHGLALKDAHSVRNEMLDDMESMYLMEWDFEEAVKSHAETTQVTRSPSVHNKVEGAVRLLSTTAPKFSVPRETNKQSTDAVASTIEQWCGRVFENACRASGEKIDRSVAQSIILFGECYLAVDRTEDIVTQLEGRRGKEKDDWLEVAITRAKTTARRAPYLFTVWDPRTCYPDFDKLGLRCLYREVATSVGAVIDEFGDVEGLNPEHRTDEITLCSYWDFVYRYIWLEDKGAPILAEKHGLPFLPIVAQLGEGSRSLFPEVENWRLPMLYPVWRSNQWDNECLYLTVLNTNIAAWGSNPMFNLMLNNLERDVDIDASVPGGVIRLEKGESFGPTPKVVVDPSILMGLERAQADIEASTIFSQTLGQPIGPDATYSATALLHQAGRLPLAMPQEMAGRALAGALKIALQWTKKVGKETRAGSYNYTTELKPSDIPDDLELDCKLDVALPQDRLGNVNVARMATDPNNPLASQEWAMTNIMGIEQPELERKRILKERLLNFLEQDYIQQQIQQRQQQQQMEQAMMQQQAQPQMQQPPMQPQQGAPGMPPEMMQGGMQGPQQLPGEEQMLPPEEEEYGPEYQ